MFEFDGKELTLDQLKKDSEKYDVTFEEYMDDERIQSEREAIY